MTKRNVLTLLALFAVMMLGVFIGRQSGEAPSKQASDIAVNSGVRKIQIDSNARAALQSKARFPEKAIASIAPLPVPGTPLGQTIAELQQRADAGDADAASRLYRDMQRCAERRHILATMPDVAARILDKRVEKMSDVESKARDSLLGTVQSKLKFASENAALCDGVSSAQLQDVVPAALRAAQLGDDNAADCYVGSDLGNQPGLLDHPEWYPTTRKTRSLLRRTP